MRELRAPIARRGGSRGNSIVSGMLALLLVTMLAATAVFAAKPAAVSAQSDKLDTAALAPASSAMYISVTLDQTSAQYQKAITLFSRLGVSDPIQTAVEDLTKQSGASAADEVKPFLGGELGFVITDLSALTGVANSVTASGVSGLTSGAMLATPIASELGSVSGFAAVLKPGDPAAAWTNAQKALSDEASNNGVSVNETTYNGVTIKSVETGSGSSSNNLAIAQVNDFIVLGTTAKDLEPIIDTAQGKTDSLAKSADFTKAQGALRSDFLAFGYVNGAAVSSAQLTGTPVSSAQSASTMSSLETLLGPFAMSISGNSGFVVWADDPGFRIDTVSLPVAGQTAPVAQNFQSQLPAKVSGDTMIFANGLDLGKNPILVELGLAAAEGITGQQTGGTPPAGMTADEYANQVFAAAAQSLGFNFKTDFLDQLTGEYGLSLSVKSLDPTGINFVLISGAADTAKLNDALSKISLLVSAGGQGAITVTTKEVGGSQISIAAGTYSGIPIQIEYGVINKQFVLGYGTSVEQFAAGVANSLAANPQYQQVMATLPAQHNSELYIDVKSIAAVVGPIMSAMSGSTEMMATPGESGTPSMTASSMQALSAIEAFAAVGFEKNGMSESSAIIYIPAK